MRTRMLMPAALVALALTGTGCGGGGGIGAVNSMPSNATDKSMQKAEECDDGELASCRWIGIWFMLGGAGKDRRYEGRRFLDYACREGDGASCKLKAALEKAANKSSSNSGSTSGSGSSGSGSSGSFSDLVGGGGGGSSSGAGACESSLPSGVPDDVREGARKCDNGEQKFCHAIAFWYLKGNGGKERRVDGVKWFKHACERGYQPSCEAIETIKRKLEEMKAQGKI